MLTFEDFKKAWKKFEEETPGASLFPNVVKEDITCKGLHIGDFVYYDWEEDCLKPEHIVRVRRRLLSNNKKTDLNENTIHFLDLLTTIEDEDVLLALWIMTLTKDWDKARMKTFQILQCVVIDFLEDNEIDFDLTEQKVITFLHPFDYHNKTIDEKLTAIFKQIQKIRKERPIVKYHITEDKEDLLFALMTF